MALKNRRAVHPKFPAFYADCEQRLKAKADSIIVIAGPSEWIWRSAKSWQSTGDWGVLVLRPGDDPMKLRWDVCIDRLVRVWYQATHTDIEALELAIVRWGPRTLIAVDFASDDPRSTIRRWDRET